MLHYNDCNFCPKRDAPPKERLLKVEYGENRRKIGKAGVHQLINYIGFEVREKNVLRRLKIIK